MNTTRVDAYLQGLNGPIHHLVRFVSGDTNESLNGIINSLEVKGEYLGRDYSLEVFTTRDQKIAFAVYGFHWGAWSVYVIDDIVDQLMTVVGQGGPLHTPN